MDKYDYKGAIHIHSTCSDGYATVEEIMKAANDTGLDFVILTDHDTLKAKEEGHEKWHDSTMLIVGCEITPPENHYVIMGDGNIAVDKLKTMKVQDYINAVNDQNWFGFLSHPDFTGAKKFGVGSYKWTDWNVENFTGMGIWTLLDDWLRQVDSAQEPTFDLYDNFPKHLKGPTEEVMKRWDAYTKTRKVVAIGEVDNHKFTKRFEDRELVIFPCEVALRTVTNHILLDEPLSKDFNKAKIQVLDAIKNGLLYISFDWFSDPTEFSFTIENGKEIAHIGDRMELSDETAELCVSLPEDAEINLIKDGEAIANKNSFELVEDIKEKGVYRVEVKKDDLYWIISNPVYVD